MICAIDSKLKIKMTKTALREKCPNITFDVMLSVLKELIKQEDYIFNEF